MTDFPGSGRPVAATNDHACFGCGQLNANGLRLVFVEDPAGSGVITEFTPQAHVEGYPGVVHGGIITTVLDEVMAWSLYRHNIWAVTGELTTRYRQPIRIGEPTTALGAIVADRRRALEGRGEIRRAADGVLLADGRATFIRVPEDRAAAFVARYGVTGGEREG